MPEAIRLLQFQIRGDVFVWGRNYNGCLGLSHCEDVYLPQKNNFFSNLEEIVVKIFSREIATIFLTDKGNVYVCGGKNQEQSIPRKLNISNVIDISGDKNSYYALKSDHCIYSLKLRTNDHKKIDLENIIQIDSSNDGLMVMTSSLEIFYIYHDWEFGYGIVPEKIVFSQEQSARIKN